MTSTHGISVLSTLPSINSWLLTIDKHKGKGSCHEDHEQIADARTEDNITLFFYFPCHVYILLMLLMVSNIIYIYQYVIYHELVEGSVLRGQKP